MLHLLHMLHMLHLLPVAPLGLTVCKLRMLLMLRTGHMFAVFQNSPMFPISSELW